MKITSALSEISGMFAADGSMQKDYICMWGNITEDKEYYDNHMVPLFSILTNKKINVHEKKSNSVYGFYLCKKEVIDLFNKKLNFPIGKKTYIVKVPNSIFKSKNIEIYSSFIRGFTDCDGCISFFKRYAKGYSKFKRKFHTYPRIDIISTSQVIIKQISEMLKFLKIKHTVHRKKKHKPNRVDSFSISIKGKERLNHWMEKIGFKNPSKITKYQIWKKFGFCPPYTTIEDRRKILKGEINPYSYYGPVTQSG